MVYSIGRVGVHEIEPQHYVVNSEEAWAKVEYLNPDKVDRHAKARDHLPTGYGYPLAPDSTPKSFVWKSKTKRPPDYAFGINSVMLVSYRFRDLVKQFEPGVHQFLPVKMYHSEADVEPFDEFYWFVCCTLIDSLDPKKTTYTWRGFYDERMEDGLRRGYWKFDQSVEPKQKPVFDLNAIADHHLWRDPYIASRVMVYCSDSFANALKSAALSGFALNPKDQV